MRVFIYTTKVKSTSRTYGYQIIEARIYEVKNNLPVIVLKEDEKGEPCGQLVATWQTGSTMGELSEVYHALSNAGIIAHVPRDEYYHESTQDIKIMAV